MCSHHANDPKRYITSPRSGKRISSGIDRFEAQISCRRSKRQTNYWAICGESNIIQENEGLLTSVNVGLSDLEKQLTWAAAVIERSTTLIGDLAGANREQPPIWSTVSASTSLLPQDLSTVIKSAPPELPKRRSVDEEHDRNDFRRKLSVQMHRDTQLGEQFLQFPAMEQMLLSPVLRVISLLLNPNASLWRHMRLHLVSSRLYRARCLP